MQLTGYFNLGFSPNGPQPRKDTNLLGTDIFTKIVGAHSLKFGATFEQFGVANPYFAQNNGEYAVQRNRRLQFRRSCHRLPVWVFPPLTYKHREA